MDRNGNGTGWPGRLVVVDGVLVRPRSECPERN